MYKVLKTRISGDKRFTLYHLLVLSTEKEIVVGSSIFEQYRKEGKIVD